MEKSRYFQDLTVWKKAHTFVLAVYKASELFPKSELFGLVSQFRRAAVSIAANIAEGYKRKGKKDKLRFYNFSQGSLEECRYYIILSKDLGYIDEKIKTELITLIEETSKILNAYCHKIIIDNAQTSQTS
jgi:four helix bundle protein